MIRSQIRTPWRRRAEAVAGSLPLERLHAGALAEIRRAAAAGERVAVACSGGADSVALVCTLWAHLPELRGRWLILHFDHALRGRASTADARSVAALARGLGERCGVARWNEVGRGLRPSRTNEVIRARGSTGGLALPQTAVSENDAREARFAFFARAMQEAGARVLVLGHQADDVIETMLMRLVRGSGTGGLAAPRPVHRRADGSVRVRPLLACEGAELRAALRAAGAPWREDASNAGDAYLRNRVRQRVLPALRAAAGRALAGGFLAARQALDDDDAALELWLAEVAGATDARRWRALAGRPRALARRAVHGWLHQMDLADTFSRSAAEPLIDAVAQGRPIRVSAGAERFVVFDGQRLVVELAEAAPVGWGTGGVLAVPGEVTSADGAILRAREVRLTPALRRDIVAGRFSASRIVFLATDLRSFGVRRRQPGDRYRPLGAPGRARLQDLFVNRKIPRGMRAALPVVCDTQNLPLWVPGLPPADDMAVRRGTKLVVQLTYIPAGAIVARP